MRQALAGMLWSKQYYYFDLDRWLQRARRQPIGAPAQVGVRNPNWHHMVNDDIISMPDKWEYPWYAAWDLAFHTVALDMVDPQFARDQIEIMLSERYLHPNGQLPAYEWNFGDVNPPVHAWATLFSYHSRHVGGHGRPRVPGAAPFRSCCSTSRGGSTARMPNGRNIFEGGFLGLDNIGVFDRSAPLPAGGPPRAGRRHGLDGVLLPRTCCEIARRARRATIRRTSRWSSSSSSTSCGLPRRWTASGKSLRRAVGRGGRVLLRRAAHARRQRDAPQGPVDGGPAAARRDDGDLRRGTGALSPRR